MKVHQRLVDGDGGQDRALAALAAEVDRLRHDLTLTQTSSLTLRGDVDAHTRTLTDLSDLLRRVTTHPTHTHAGSPNGRPVGGASAGGASSDEEPGGCPEWMTVTDPALAVAWLTALTGWVRDVWTHYSPLPACWPWHPAVVAELLACHGAWTAALAPEAAPEAIANWHDRWRPATQHRVEHTLAGCQRAHGLHIDGAARYDIDPAWLDEYAVHWATTHTPTAGGAPGLTPNRQDRR